MGECPAHSRQFHPRQVVLGCIGEKAEQAHKECSSMVSASVPVPRFLPWLPEDDESQAGSFLLLWLWCFSNRSPKIVLMEKSEVIGVRPLEEPLGP